jgi:hypothetical protein
LEFDCGDERVAVAIDGVVRRFNHRGTFIDRKVKVRHLHDIGPQAAGLHRQTKTAMDRNVVNTIQPNGI